LLIAHCSLLIAHCSLRKPRKPLLLLELRRKGNPEFLYLLSIASPNNPTQGERNGA
jgi:hypothetical protein